MSALTAAPYLTSSREKRKRGAKNVKAGMSKRFYHRSAWAKAKAGALRPAPVVPAAPPAPALFDESKEQNVGKEILKIT